LHNAKVLVGVNYETYNTDSLYGYGEDFTNDDKLYLSQTQSNFTTADSYYHRAQGGWFGRLNYDYDGK
jgi:hypothetical protein